MNMGSSQVDGMGAVGGGGQGFCPASLCRLLRGIAAGGPQGATLPAAPSSMPGGHSFTIAAILGLKGHDTRNNHEIPSSGTPGQFPGGQSGGRGRPRAAPHSPPALPTGSASLHHTSKSKRVRTIFTPEQLERLEAEFERQQYMVGPERLYLAHALQLTEAQVKVWFQNRRIKWRKQHLELTQQRLALARRQMADQMDASSSNSMPEES